jgi:hypothetical protein
MPQVDLRRIKSDSSNAEKDGPSEERQIAISVTQNRGRSMINEAPKFKAPAAGRDKSANSVDQLFKMMRQENRLKRIANAKVVTGQIS